MYNVAPADRPMPRWQTIIYGWYIPACLALIWLTNPFGIYHYQMDTTSSNTIQTIADNYQLLRYGFLASIMLNASILLVLNPKKHGWIGLTWLIGIAIASILYPLLDISAGLGKLFTVVIPSSDNYYYMISIPTILTGMFLSCSLIIVQNLVNPKAYQSGRSLIVAWLALWIITTAYISPRVILNLPIVRNHLS